MREAAEKCQLDGAALLIGKLKNPSAHQRRRFARSWDLVRCREGIDRESGAGRPLMANVPQPRTQADNRTIAKDFRSPEKRAPVGRAKIGRAPPDLQEDLLQEGLSFVCVLEHLQGQSVEPARHLIINLRESGAISLRRAAQQVIFIEAGWLGGHRWRFIKG